MKPTTKKMMALGLLGMTATGLLAAGVSAQDESGAGLGQFDAVKEAVDAGDYDAFVLALQDAGVDAQVSEEQFAKMVERHDTKDAVRLAIEAQDYDAWVTAVSATPHGADIIDVVSEDEFDELLRIHELREEIRELEEEIGLPSPHERGHGKGMMQGGERGAQGQDTQRRGPPQGQFGGQDLGERQGGDQGQIGGQQRGPGGQTGEQGAQRGPSGWLRGLFGR